MFSPFLRERKFPFIRERRSPFIVPLFERGTRTSCAPSLSETPLWKKGLRADLWRGGRGGAFRVAVALVLAFGSWLVPTNGAAAGRGVPTTAAAADRELRVCADPNNLPFSNERGEGFENRIAELLARDLGAKLDYTWWAQRRGFIRNTLGAHLCDVVIGVPAGYDLVLTTHPYYRSTYVFVTRKQSGIALSSFDDPQLRKLKIGVHLIGNDGVNVPPAHALTRRGIITNVSGYSIY